MSLSATGRDLARQRNELRLSGLAGRLDELKGREIASSADLVEAFRPIVEMAADLLRETDTSRSQVADLLDRLEATLNRLEFAMGQAPEQMKAAAAETVEGMAERMGRIVEALNNLGKAGSAQMRGIADDAKATQQSAQLAIETTAKQTGQQMARALAQVEKAATAQQVAAEAQTEAARRSGQGMLLTVAATAIGSVLLTSGLLLLAAWRMGALPGH